MKSQLYSLLKFVIGWPFSLIALFFIAKLILPQKDMLLENLTRAHIGLLIVGILSFILFYLLRSYLWYRLIRGYNDTIRFKQSCYLWAASELKRYIPGNVWSFLGRTILFSEQGIAKKDIAACLIIEAELFVLGAGAVSLLALPYVFLGFKFTFLSGVLLAALVGGLLVIYIYSHKMFHRIKVLRHFFPKSSPRETFLLFIISCVALVAFGFGNYMIAGAVIPLHPQLIVALTGFFTLSLLLGYLSLLTPAGFGVREGIVIWGLVRFMTTSIAAFAALFSRIFLVIAELIFIGIAYLWYRTKSSSLKRIEKWINTHKHLFILGIAALCYVLYFSITSFLRYDQYYTGRFDLGNMVQTVWNTTQGRIFLFTNPDGVETVSRLAFHADFILIFLAPFYLLWSDPRMLLLLQSVVLAAGAFFVYLIAQRHLHHKTLALLFALAYFLNPSVQRTNLYDFHAVTFATTFLLAAYYFFIEKRYKYFLLFAILAAFCKEHLWLVTGLFGVFLFLFHKKRLLGASIAVISVTLFYFLVSYAIPQSLGEQHFALKYYADFGDSPSAVIKTILFSPDKLLDVILQHERIEYLKQLFMPLGYLSLLAPVFLVFAVPDLLVNLLSNNAQLHQIYYQYTATITPFLFVTAIHAVMILKKLLPVLPYTAFGIYLVVFSLYGAYMVGPLPGAKEPNLDMYTKPLSNRQLIDKYIASIPQEYKVAASNTVASHLSEREHIYVLPLGKEKADILVFLLTPSEQSQSLAAQQTMIEALRKDQQFVIDVEKDNFIVFKRKGVK